MLNQSDHRGPAISALTSVRFFFASAVVVGHFGGHFPSSGISWPAFFGQMAPTAVSWFFILSGFIITYNYPVLSTGPDRARFIISRIARLWPVHVATLIAAVFIVGSGKPLWFLSHLTLTQTWLADANVAGAYNGPSWSVSNEMFFYIAYVALILPKWWMRLLAVVVPIAIGVALPFFDGCFVPTTDPAGAANSAACVTDIFLFPAARLIEFLAGVALCRLRPRVPQLVGLFMAAAVLAYVLPALPGLGNGPWPILWRQVAIIMGGGALICSLARDGWLSRILDNRPLMIGGEISYSMYMVHQLVMFMLLPRVGNWSLPLQFLVVASVVIAVSMLLFYSVEQPVRDAVKRWLRNRRPISRSAGDNAAAIAG
jgi:peptidoglycan/LPS O-acetylase OafA/YrhL